MITEEEAKTKWCPMIRVTPGDNHWERMTNREEPLKSQYDECRCIASACMAWRWAEAGWEHCTTDNRTPDFKEMVKRARTHPTEQSIWLRPEGEPPPPPGHGWERVGDSRQSENHGQGVFIQKWRRPRPDHRGRCGLAGNGE